MESEEDIGLPTRIVDLKSHFETVFENKDPWHLGSSSYEQQKYESQLQLISSFTQQPSTLLELGSAEGHFTKLAARELEVEITTVEISSKALQRARSLLTKEKARIEFINCDSLEYIKESERRKWDIIVWSESIHYSCRSRTLAEMIKAIETIPEILNEKGILCMTNTTRVIDQVKRYNSQSLFSTLHYIFSQNLESIHKSKHIHYKSEDGVSWEYENWVFCSKIFS